MKCIEDLRAEELMRHDAQEGHTTICHASHSRLQIQQLGSLSDISCFATSYPARSSLAVAELNRKLRSRPQTAGSESMLIFHVYIHVESECIRAQEGRKEGRNEVPRLGHSLQWRWSNGRASGTGRSTIQYAWEWPAEGPTKMPLSLPTL